MTGDEIRAFVAGLSNQEITLLLDEILCSGNKRFVGIWWEGELLKEWMELASEEFEIGDTTPEELMDKFFEDDDCDFWNTDTFEYERASEYIGDKMQDDIDKFLKKNFQYKDELLEEDEEEQEKKED